MTKTSIYCYEKNGGSCRNRVSLANNYICGAGHGGAVSQGPPVVAPVVDLSKMNDNQKHELAQYLSTPPETLAKMAEDKNWYIRKAVAGNSSASPELLDKLAKDEDEDVCVAVAGNRSASPDTHIYLAELGYPPHGFTRGKSIDALITDIHLVDQYPETFGRAYLNRLTYTFTPEDKTHPKRRALIGYVYAKYVESDKSDSYNKQLYKERVKTLFPDDQEMAEMIGC